MGCATWNIPQVPCHVTLKQTILTLSHIKHHHSRIGTDIRIRRLLSPLFLSDNSGAQDWWLAQSAQLYLGGRGVCIPILALGTKKLELGLLRGMGDLDVSLL